MSNYEVRPGSQPEPDPRWWARHHEDVALAVGTIHVVLLLVLIVLEIIAQVRQSY